MTPRRACDEDVDAIFAIVNDAAQAYRGAIPADRWHEPYMPREELLREIAAGVEFWVAEDGGRVVGVMGLQDKGGVALVRHAYVSTGIQRTGIGSRLLRHVLALTPKPVLIGTWAAASWAIDFYRRNGFAVVAPAQKERLLRAYWTIPERQVATSVVLADPKWREREAIDWREGVRIVKGAALGEALRDPSGLGRVTVVDFAAGGDRGPWIGMVTLAAQGSTGHHYHGRHEVLIYVVRGRAEIRWGERLEFASIIEPGDFAYFAPFVPHQELNPDAKEAVDFVVVRSDNERIAVRLEGK
ncbi:MAG TPA: GNAT family N-acetyltransferase [Usitatibacter sp.]|nr:GNAT family N-acetyltransferase [Usitatibacter sp.]